MILGGQKAMGDVELTVDPIVLVNPATGDMVQGPPGYVLQGTAAKHLDWGWIIAAALAGLAVGWWLVEGDRRGRGPT